MRSLSDRDGISHLITRRLGIDTRGLAALRISIGLLILADLAIRATDLVAFYTDAGVLPRAVLFARFPTLGRLSIHALSGAVWVQWVLFGIAALVAIALVVGYRTRTVAVVSWILLVSLHLRNPVLLNAGDSLLRRLLFWGLFIPLGATWSIDAIDSDGSADRVASVATAAILLQVVLVYTVNAVLKLQSPLWLRGDAIRYVFGLDQLTVGFGDLLAGYPMLLETFDYLWLALVIVSPLLLVMTGRRRTALAGLFALMHLGMAMTMRLGLFPLVSIAALFPFLHSGVWDRVEARLGSVLHARVDFPDVSAPGRPAIHPSQTTIARLHQAASVLVVVLLVLVLYWNAATVGAVSLPKTVTDTVDPEAYRWDMFAPDPRGNDGWYVVPGRLESGDEIDAFHRRPVTWNRPPDLAATFPSHRWFVYLLDLLAPRNQPLRGPFADYLCRRWNTKQSPDLVNLSIYYVEEPVRLDGHELRRGIAVGGYSC